MAGSPYHQRGGTTDFLCLPNKHEYGKIFKAGKQGRSPLVSAEYETFAGDPLAEVSDEIVPCAVCHVSRRETVLTIPAGLTCPDEWAVEYRGYLMSSHANHSRRSIVCVDRDPESLCEEGKNGNGALLYHVEAGSIGLNSDYYDPEKELACVVCSK